MDRLLLRARLFWAILTGRAKVETIHSGTLQLDLLDLRPDADRRQKQLHAVVADALIQVSEAKGGFGELVTSHLKLLVAVQVPRSRILHQQRAFVSSFDGDESRDSRYLACLLVWAAVSTRLARDQEAYRAGADPQAIRAAAQEAQLRFVKQFPDWEHWADVLGLPY